jgi:alanyl-tRNA synthetase
MQQQKERARNAAEIDTDDWTILAENESVEFVGYDSLECEVKITRYRKVQQKSGSFYHLVFDKTPFYAESGGQVGDCGSISNINQKKIDILNTIKEHNLVIHITNQLPENPAAIFDAKVDEEKRNSTANNHSATHLLHSALRKVLGTHVEQKGSLVDPEKLRFDFAHFNKLTAEEIREVEKEVNRNIRLNSNRHENRNMPVADAQKMGAMALFGEKYGEFVRVIKFGESVELCGGTHVESTGQIGFFKIISEGAIAAGIRRIEAVTGNVAEQLIFSEFDTLSSIAGLFNNPKDLFGAVENVVNENSQLKKNLEVFRIAGLKEVKRELLNNAQSSGDIKMIFSILDISDSNDLKEICSQIRAEVKSFACVLGAVIDEKPYLAIAFSEDLTKEKQLHAGNLIRETAKLIQGGGGGQPFVATAGGKNPDGIKDAVEFGKNEILKVM